jgi:hypothetical protein
MFRISHTHSTRIVFVDTVDQIVDAVQSFEPGIYRLDLIKLEMLQSGGVSRWWGIAAKQADGLIVLTINP